jgi:hypothetical protein
MDFLVALEGSALATWLRESPSLWAYPTILFLHTVGIGFLAGPSAAIDLRILGVAPDLPLSCMKRFFPVMYFGFWVNAVSGAALLMVDATKMLTNPYFYIKLMLIALAIVNIQLLKTRVFGNSNMDMGSVPVNGKLLAGTSLFLWAAAITAGRLTAYLGT